MEYYVIAKTFYILDDNGSCEHVVEFLSCDSKRKWVEDYSDPCTFHYGSYDMAKSALDVVKTWSKNEDNELTEVFLIYKVIQVETLEEVEEEILGD